MRLILKEDPKEWRKFMLLACGMLLLAAGLLLRRKIVSWLTFEILASCAIFLAAFSSIFPAWFRTVYRLAMTFSFRMGQVIQPILLTLVYFLVLTPIALVLRLMGKDLLRLRKQSRESYWTEARKLGSLDQQF